MVLFIDFEIHFQNTITTKPCQGNKANRVKITIPWERFPGAFDASGKLTPDSDMHGKKVGWRERIVQCGA